MVSSTKYPRKTAFKKTVEYGQIANKIKESCSPKGTVFSQKRILLETRYPNICSHFKNVSGDDESKEFIENVIQYTEDNVAKIRVFITTPHVTEIVRDERMSFTTLISNIGGLLGVCIGFSIISLAEIGWFILNSL